MRLSTSISNDIQYLLMEEPEIICKNTYQKVREKIKNHKTNIDVYQQQKKKYKDKTKPRT